MEENLLKNLESQKIKIFTTLNNFPNIKFIKLFVSKVWNLCRMLNYTRHVKDIENNYYLLRLKDFLCDLFILIFSSINEISLHDVFNLIQLVTEVGTSWMKLEIKMTTEGWVRKIDNIMKYLISKINDVEKIINLDKKFYVIFMEYLNFYIENFLICSVNNICNNYTSNLNSSITENKCEDILKIIILIKNLKFLENDLPTKNLTINFLNFLKKIYTSQNNIEDILILCEGFDSIKFKNLLPFEILSDFYQFFIQILLNIGNYQAAEIILKNLLELVPPNSKEEIECYLLNLEINANLYSGLNEKIGDVLDIILEHKEFSFEYLEDTILLATNSFFFDFFLEIFLNKIKNAKNLKLSSSNNSLSFNYENLKNYKILCFLFIYSFFKSKFFVNNFSGNEISSLNFFNFFEILKIFSQCLLENYTYNQYEEEQLSLIPLILKNLVILFLKIEKSNENFSSYFLLEIIKKINQEREKEFVELSLEIYIQKKDYLKLKNVIKQLEEKNISKNSLFYYSEIILLIKDGIKWNSHGKINSACLELNLSEDFNIVYYLKIFNFLFENRVQDFSIISTILQNFSIKFFEIFKNQEFHKLYSDINNESNNKQNLSFFDIFYEILCFYSKLNNFSSQIIQFIEFLTTVGNHVEFIIMNENSLHLTNNITILLEIINILFNYNEPSNNENKFNLPQKICEDYPEFILIFACKLLHFLFSNFYIFSFEFFFNVEENLLKEQIRNLLDIFELYKNLSLFYFSYEFNNINNIGNSYSFEESNLINNSDQIIKYKQLAETQEKYNKSFTDGFIILKNKFINNRELINFIDEKMDFLFNSTKNIENILKVQIISKIESEIFLEEYIIEFISNSIDNKKFLFMINSILFQNGNKNLSFKFIKKLLNNVLNSFQEFVPKIYTIEEIFTLYKDLINLSDNLINKISSLKEFTVILMKLVGKIDEYLMNENTEWILYKIFTILEENKITKSEKEYSIVKQIYDDISNINFKNRSFILNNLFDIVLKKLLI